MLGVDVIPLVQKSEEAKALMMTLANESARKQASDGSRLFVILYGGKETDTLSNLRFVRFMKMASSASKNLAEMLPPTTDY